MAVSKNEAKRLVEGGGVSKRVGGQETKITDWRQEVDLQDEMVIQVGKRKFVKVKLK
jgi:tyrosyl-tRNA synthetase